MTSVVPSRLQPASKITKLRLFLTAAEPVLVLLMRLVSRFSARSSHLSRSETSFANQEDSCFMQEHPPNLNLSSIASPAPVALVPVGWRRFALTLPDPAGR